MKKTKKIILLLTVLSIVVFLALIIYIRRIQIKSGVDEVGDEYIVVVDKTIQRVDNRNNYYLVKTCLTKFYTYYSFIYDDVDNYKLIDEEIKQSIEMQKNEGIEAVYSMLDNYYKNEKGITKENILSFLKQVNSSKINILDMYVYQNDDRMYMYFIYGNLMDKKTLEISNFNIMMKVDTVNKTFSVFLDDYMNEKYSDLNIGDEINLDINSVLEKNDYNFYDYNHISDDVYVSDIFDQYKENLIYNVELAYEYLDREYRKIKFGDITSFEEYVNNNISKFITMKNKAYQKTKTDKYTQYVCIDQNNNYYIFREVAPMKYSIILDTYTVDLPEFIEKYDGSNVKEKVLINIKKFMDSLNDKDYRYAYNCLAEEFKENKFASQEIFEEYIKENLFTNNSFEFVEFANEGETYICNLSITDKTAQETNKINMQIIMELGEEIDFKMSFSI